MFKPIPSKSRTGIAGQVSLRSACQGTALVEYALVGTFVLLLSFAVLQYLGGGLNSAMAMIQDDIKGHNSAASKALALQQAKAAGAASVPAASIVVSASGLSSSERAILEQSMTSKLQTTGANGATELLAKQLDLAAAQLLLEGKIDQKQYLILMQLSNQGHRIAQVEGMLSEAVTMSNGNYETFKNTPFSWEGKQYTALDLQILLGYSSIYPSDFASNNILTANMPNPGLETANFVAYYNQALTSGALSDPLAKSTVDSAATQIASMSELVENTMWIYSMNNGVNASQLDAFMASTATQMNSANICTAGSFTDSGVLCSL